MGASMATGRDYVADDVIAHISGFLEPSAALAARRTCRAFDAAVRESESGCQAGGRAQLRVRGEGPLC